MSVLGLVLARPQVPASLPSSEMRSVTLATRTFGMIDIVDIDPLVRGRSQNELATSLGVDCKTLRKYTAPARAAGIEPGGYPRRRHRGHSSCAVARSRTQPQPGRP